MHIKTIHGQENTFMVLNGPGALPSQQEDETRILISDGYKEAQVYLDNSDRQVIIEFLQAEQDRVDAIEPPSGSNRSFDVV